MSDVKYALEKIHAKNYEPSSSIKKLKDWWIQGLQLNKCYLPQWNEIKGIFKMRGEDLNKHGPILTMNEWKNVKLVHMMAKDNVDFILMLHAFPIYCRKKAMGFEEWYYKNKDILRSMKGTIMDIDKELEDLI
jgi:hypothetical protein